MSTLHIMFHPSGGGSLIRAMEMAARTDRVMSCFDDFSFGPIKNPDSAIRAAWVERELGYPEWELSSSRTETLIAASTAPGTRPVAWISWRDVPNFCNFLHWLSCIGDAPCDIIDVSELIVTDKPRDRPPTPPELVVSPSLISLHMFHEYGLLDQAVPLERGQREGYVSLWKRLQAEDMPLRIRSQDGLCSAQINQYDSIILSFVTPDWRKMPRLVHDAMTHANENSIIQCSDIMIGGRVLALIRAGVIEARGDLSHMRTTEIRLAPSTS